MDISVIVPALNEEKSLGLVIQNTLDAFSSLGINGEIIIVDDGSRDATQSVAEYWMSHSPRVRLITHQFAEGIGRSFMDGVRVAFGDYITMLPGDNENHPQETLALLKRVSEFDAIVPWVVNPSVRGGWRRFLSKLFNLIVNMSFQTRFIYTNGTNIYRAALLEKVRVKSAGFFYQTEILVKLDRQNAVFSQIPYRLSKRVYGENKAISIESLRGVVRDYFILISDLWKQRKKERA